MYIGLKNPGFSTRISQLGIQLQVRAEVLINIITTVQIVHAYTVAVSIYAELQMQQS
jgi:hypothetical protein